MKKSRISIILPTYNEYDNIIPLIERTIEAIPEKKEILVIDDDSPDGTADLVADEISEKGLYLPSASGLKLEQIDYICDTIRKL